MRTSVGGILRLIPEGYRRRGAAVAAGAVAGVLLDFAGLAVLVPVLLLVADARRMHSCEFVERIYRSLDFHSDRSFALAVCGLVLAVIVTKSLLKMAIARYRSDYFLSLYRYYSNRLLRTYHDGGLLFVRRSGSTRLANDVCSVCMSFCYGVLGSAVSVASESLLVVTLFVATAFYDRVAAIVAAAAFVPAVWVYAATVRSRLRRCGRRENEARWRQRRIVEESFRGYDEIETYDAFPAVMKRFDGSLDLLSELRRRRETVMQIPSVLIEVCVVVATIMLAAWGVDAVAMGIFAVAALRSLPAVRSILAGWARIRDNLYTSEIVRRGAETNAAPCDTSRMSFEKCVELRGVDFRFEAGGKSVISGLDLRIARGERLGIRGASGVGKTTLFNLLLGLYVPAAGGVYVDGMELTARNRRSWQNIVGYVPQEVFVMDATVAENVSLGREPDRERVREALEAASLLEFVESLPQGIDTPAGECGCRLSGGQRQRLGIARALYREAEVLLLDEATSSLDDRTEREITEAIAALSRNRRELTVVVAAHRTSSLDFCDRVVRMEDIMRRE